MIILTHTKNKWLACFGPFFLTLCRPLPQTLTFKKIRKTLFVASPKSFLKGKKTNPHQFLLFWGENRKMRKRSANELAEPCHFVHDGLTQRSVRSMSYADDKHGPTQIETVTTLPFFVLPSHWVANKLTESDVHALMENVPARILWLCCLVHGLDIVPSSLKPSTAKMTEILISYHKQALTSLLDFAKLKANSEHVLQETARHKKGGYFRDTKYAFVTFPTIEFETDVVHRVTESLCDPLLAFCVNKIKYVFEWNSQLFVPTHIQTKTTIVLRRLASYDDWKKSHATTTQFGICSVPLIVEYQSKFFIVCEDGILMKLH